MTPVACYNPQSSPLSPPFPPLSPHYPLTNRDVLAKRWNLNASFCSNKRIIRPASPCVRVCFACSETIICTRCV